MSTSFDLEVWESKNIQVEDFNIRGSCPWISKSLIWKFGDPKTLKLKILIAAFGTCGDRAAQNFKGLRAYAKHMLWAQVRALISQQQLRMLGKQLMYKNI